MIDETTTLIQIERQLSKLESTATNLETLSAAATRTNKMQEAKTLNAHAVDLRLKQFSLYRNKARLQIDTKEWKALVSAIELLNHFIDEAIYDQKKIKEVQDVAAQLINVATKMDTA